MRDVWFRSKLALNAVVLRAAAGLFEGERRRTLEELADAFERLREAA